MIGRHIKMAGIQLIEAALAKMAMPQIAAPSLASLKAKKTRELGTAKADVPKILTPPTA
jgi:hypothetical protein